LVQASRDDGFSFWPTMRANDYQPICWHRARMINRGERPNRNGGCANLNDYAGVWAIRHSHPVLSTRAGHEQFKKGGRLPLLNVGFAEQMSGFPLGWTACDASATP